MEQKLDKFYFHLTIKVILLEFVCISLKLILLKYILCTYNYQALLCNECYIFKVDFNHVAHECLSVICIK